VTVVPQGLTEEQFSALSAKVRAATRHLSSDIHVHGSRAAGTARASSDLDIAIRVSVQQFDELLRRCFGTPNPGSAKERTLQRARATGKIQAGEVGLRLLRRDLETDLGMAVDLSVVCQAGAFDQGPYVPLAGADSGGAS